MKLPYALVLVAIAACATAESQSAVDTVAYDPSQEGFSGTEVCYGCRLEQEVTLQDGRRIVRSQRASACSEWVMQQVANHEHGWAQIGCWYRETFFSKTVACTRAPWPGILPADQWLSYLQTLTDHRRNEAISATAVGDKQPLVDCQAWAAQQARSSQP